MSPVNHRHDMSLIFPLFSYLHDIDDALHLARTCKGVYTVFDGYYARAWIFRCIIRNAPHHENDARLSGVQILRDSFNWEQIPIGAFNKRKQFLDGFDFELDAENIFAISWRTFWDQDLAVKEDYLADSDPLRRSHALHVKISRFTPDQRRRAYQRFYKALTTQWCALEHFYLSRVLTYPDKLEQNAFNNLTRMKWRYNPHRCLSDKLDILEVTDFVWEFLPRKVFDSESPDACNPDDPTYLVERMFLLRPPQIIQLMDLALRASPRSLPSRSLLFDDMILEYHRFDGKTQGLDAEILCMMDLEDEVANYIWRASNRSKELGFVLPEMNALSAWCRYRTQAWWWDCRGRILFRSEGPRMLVTRILEHID